MEEIKIPLSAYYDLVEYFAAEDGTDKKSALEGLCVDHLRFLFLRQAEREAYKKLIALPVDSEKAEEAKAKYMEYHTEKKTLQEALYSAPLVL